MDEGWYKSQNTKSLSYKEKQALELFKDKGELYPQDLLLVYSSRYNIKNCLLRLKVLGFISLMESGRWIYLPYKEEQQKLVMKNQ